jgi:hypothetical protein
MLAVTAGAVVCGVSAILNWPGIVVATPAFQFSSEILARSFFEEIAVNTRRERALRTKTRRYRSRSKSPRMSTW